jgi:hypothetical protein
MTFCCSGVSGTPPTIVAAAAGFSRKSPIFLHASRLVGGLRRRDDLGDIRRLESFC